ncbi:MAG: ABC transporter permease subunit [Candidatus Thermoplasmatota archaeon]
MDYFVLKQILRFKIAIQTVYDHWKSTLVLTLLFSGMAAMYSGMYPAFEDMMKDMQQSGALDQFAFIPGYQDMSTYVGFLNIEMYQIFWVLILGIIIGFIAASLVSKEIEGKTFDLLMSNPLSRKQIIFEKFVGLLPMVLIINLGAMLTIIGSTIAINEQLDFYHLFLTHGVSVLYFLSIISLGLLISTIFDEKMKATIVTMAVVVGMFILDSIAQMIPDYEYIGYLSLKNYYKPYETLKFGDIDVTGLIVFVVFTAIVLIITMFYFEHKDIKV